MTNLSLDTPELVKRLAYGKGQIAYLQAMITKRSAEMVVAAIKGEDHKDILQAMQKHLEWIEDVNAGNSEIEAELWKRTHQGDVLQVQSGALPT